MATDVENQAVVDSIKTLLYPIARPLDTSSLKRFKVYSFIEDLAHCTRIDVFSKLGFDKGRYDIVH